MVKNWARISTGLTESTQLAGLAHKGDNVLQ